MKTTTNIAAAILLLAAAHTVAAGPTPNRPVYGHSELCYQQTVLASQGAKADELSTVSCTRALRDTPMRASDKSVVLYNRGIIERARGDTAAARDSFERAVRLSATVDTRNLALAQLAHRQGDYAVAIEQYELLIEAPGAGVVGAGVLVVADARIAAQRDAIERNLAAAEQAQLQQARRVEDPVGIADE